MFTPDEPTKAQVQISVLGFLYNLACGKSPGFRVRRPGFKHWDSNYINTVFLGNFELVSFSVILNNSIFSFQPLNYCENYG